MMVTSPKYTRTNISVITTKERNDAIRVHVLGHLCGRLLVLIKNLQLPALLKIAQNCMKNKRIVYAFYAFTIITGFHTF